MSTIPERLCALRTLMQERGIDAYLVPTDDFHGSEYVGDYFKCRKYITGFTGSAGTAVILKDSAGLWTDGRYFIQAAAQLEDSGFDLYKMGNEGVPTVKEFLEQSLGAGQVLGFDGRTISAGYGKELEAMLSPKQVSIVSGLDLVGEIWEDRPPISAKPVWTLDPALAGATRSQKIAGIREKMQSYGCNQFLLPSLDDIAWLLNLRGDDVKCNPVVLSYLAMTEENVFFFVQEEAFDPANQPNAYIQALHLPWGPSARQELEADGITLRPYHDIYEYVRQIPAGQTVLLDEDTVNYALRSSIPAGVKVVSQENPTILPKAAKTPEEVENMRIAHVKDGVAMTRFLYWLKKNVGKQEITELSAGAQLEVFRGMQENYLGPSFDPIVGYAEHGAIVHYSATPQTDVPLKPEGSVLIDCGGQYLEGTTDITRTILLGEISQKQKEFSTRVMRGNLNLAAAKFLYGCGGRNLDYLARAPLWEVNVDYNHGTGHGVGALLNVHEGPQRIHWRGSKGSETPFEEGMITSDEPGYYLEGEFGIRHENLMVCKKAEKTEAGQYMEFETLTLVPFDLDGVIPEQMSERERALLNAYHQKVYETISPHLPEEEREWLREVTKEI